MNFYQQHFAVCTKTVLLEFTLPMTTVPISPRFRRFAVRAVMSIILFLLVYFLLFLLSIAVLAAAGYGAAMLIAVKFSFITIGLGIGLLAVGMFIVFFMIKFMFTKNKTDYSDLILIDLEQHPELNKMIRELVIEVDTTFPKKVYVSPEVNASVFYDSAFWSMFFPVKKNLHIGLGLVNTCTVSELKGILAHEFGHFSQRSMKVGSYVYNVNQVIHNILYDNEEYHNAMVRWSNSSGYFFIFIGIANYFNKFVQFVLRQMYRVVNLNYLALSREMEFHADAIAAHVVGSAPMISSLQRLDLASAAYSNVIAYYSSNIERSVTTENIFPQHLIGLHFLGINSNLEIVNGLPFVPVGLADRFNKSKLILSNQWESHPSLTDRVKALEKIDISIDHNNEPANSLFSNLLLLQQEVTKKMFVDVKYGEIPKIESDENFISNIKSEYQSTKLPEIFNGYYDGYSPKSFDLDKVDFQFKENQVVQELYTNHITELTSLTNAMRNDAEILRAIAEKRYDANTFDYDGHRYKASDAASLHKNLLKDLEHNEGELEKHDQKIYAFFYESAQRKLKSATLIQRYKDYFTVHDQYGQDADMYSKMNADFAFAFEVLQPNVIIQKMVIFKRTEELFRKRLEEMLSEPLYNEVITIQMQTDIKEYLAIDRVYFAGQQYCDQSIIEKNQILEHFTVIIQDSFYNAKKKLLEFQASLID